MLRHLCLYLKAQFESTPLRKTRPSVQTPSSRSISTPPEGSKIFKQASLWLRPMALGQVDGAEGHLRIREISRERPTAKTSRLPYQLAFHAPCQRDLALANGIYEA